MGSTSGGFFFSSQILDQLGHELMRIIPKMRKPSASEEEEDDFITPPRCFTVQTIHDVLGSSVHKCSYEITSGTENNNKIFVVLAILCDLVVVSVFHLFVIETALSKDGTKDNRNYEGPAMSQNGEGSLPNIQGKGQQIHYSI